MAVIADMSAGQQDADTSALLHLYEFICNELAIPASDVAKRVKVALSVSAAYYTLHDDGKIIETVIGALSV
jgi:hypothetical protein